MASVPLVTITNLYQSAKRHAGDWVKAGRNYRACYKDGKFELTHYGTLILTTDENRRTYAVGVGAWSASDRDAINTVMHNLGVGVRVRVCKGDIITAYANPGCWTEIPIRGVIMQYIITCWFGQEIDTTMYWTGIGLLAVFGTVLSVKSNDND